jgi:hypothetical protein
MPIPEGHGYLELPREISSYATIQSAKSGFDATGRNSAAGTNPFDPKIGPVQRRKTCRCSNPVFHRTCPWWARPRRRLLHFYMPRAELQDITPIARRRSHRAPIARHHIRPSHSNLSDHVIAACSLLERFELRDTKSMGLPVLSAFEFFTTTTRTVRPWNFECH